MSEVKSTAKNVLGEELKVCGCEPMTGFYRDGFCNTGEGDFGSHTVCAVVDEEFLEYTKLQGNDLSTPVPQYGFPGLKPGDHWCVCAARWKEAFEAGKAPRVMLECTHEKALKVIDLESLKTHSAIQ
ncbi:MAG: DUF2237 domain-containing protein [Pseudomonadota bacterium]